MTDGTVVLRVQEIIHRAERPITGRDAIKQALGEKYQTKKELLEALTSACLGIQGQLRKSTYDIPEQDTLFDLPQVIAVSTAEGTCFVHSDDALLGQVRQWNRECRQHHSTQTRRHNAVAKQLDAIKTEPDDLPWAKARERMLEAVELKAVEL